MSNPASRSPPSESSTPAPGAGPAPRPLSGRAIYREIPVYAPLRAPCALDLSDNTNMFGVPPAARRAIAEVSSAAVTRYPPLYAHELKAALAQYVGVSPHEVVTGCGSDDVLDSAIRAFSEPGDRLAFSDPTFAMIPLFAQMNGLTPVPVPAKDDFDADIDALLATEARILYLCSPNNPTGSALSPAAIERLCREARGLVMLDEAYVDYAQADPRALRRDRLLVVRTLSKAFGLAGLRVGYAVGDPAVVADVEKSRGPYKVTALAERAALAALTEDLPWVRAHVDEVVRNRSRFTEALRGLGLKPLPSAANFVLVPVPDAAGAAARMRAAGVAVRPFPGLRSIGDALRISIGSQEMMDTALTRLQEALR